MDMRSSRASGSDRYDLEQALRDALTANILPGEGDGLEEQEVDAIAAFVASIASFRRPGLPAVEIKSSGLNSQGKRRMRLAVINDDMPFLVDSIAAILSRHGLDVYRLLHPVVAVRRDAQGELTAVLPQGDSGERLESIIYMEIERADSRLRRTIQSEIDIVLAEVREAVHDWPRMQMALRADADRLPDGEGAALLRWFLAGNFTNLGHHIEVIDKGMTDPIGILKVDPTPLWSEADRKTAFAWFADGKDAPLVTKSSRISLVHRSVPMDLLVVPIRENGAITALSVHSGLWTSAALKAQADAVPVLRTRLKSIESKFGFARDGHAGKALRHVLASLPHDLLISFDAPMLEQLALTAMSLSDRPRPKLMLVSGPLKRNLFAFVWLTRDEISTARRSMIGDLLGKAAKASLTSWSLQVDDGDLALIRFTFDLSDGGVVPDVEPLDRQISEMLRGWAPAVETALAEQLPISRATRLAISWANAFPVSYRERYDAREAALDIQRIISLAAPEERAVRLYRTANDRPENLRLKLYRSQDLVMLSEAVPVFENFGFVVLKEVPTRIQGPHQAQIYEFLLSVESGSTAEALLGRADIAEQAIAAVLEGHAENDAFNQLIIAAGLDPQSVLLFRAWFRYMRQARLTYSVQTVVDALGRAPTAARALIALFTALHDPTSKSEKAAKAADAEIEAALVNVVAIIDDRILRWLHSLVRATLRTNAFMPAAKEALAFKFDSGKIPDLPAPVPWREIWVYSPRVEGIHLRGGPIARGGLRWSDRRDDFRTEILGLMKAQVVKNAVIVPTGAKGGFYPKALPAPSERDAWMAEGTESYRIFIRTLLSITDNIVNNAVVHPEGVTILDGDDPYFVVAADKGTASFSDIANAIAIERGFWLGDAFASGGSQGYDHKAMGITAKGAWISVQRHFAEMGIDVHKDPVRVAGCGDMSGDVFGNGMLLSKSIRLVAAFDHRHIFFDPEPDPEASWKERERMFALPRSSWADYNPALISKGGGVYPRTQKSIPLSPEVQRLLGLDVSQADASTLIAAILRSEVDLLWFGGIGTYIKAADEANIQVGDPANDAHRVDGGEVRAKVIGEGANLGITQAGRIGFATRGGRINTDFIDNSAGVDCSDNEVNIKIPLNREMIEGRLSFDDRNDLLKAMTDDVSALVLEDNRLQTLALSLAERGGVSALPSHIRVIETLEATGRLNRRVDGLASNEELNRRRQQDNGLTRPELSVLLSHSKLALQADIEQSSLARDPLLAPLLEQAFPKEMRERFGEAIAHHRLRDAIIATKLANRIVNRLGFVIPSEVAEEEGVSLARVAAAYATIDAIFAIQPLWEAIEASAMSESARLSLLSATADAVRIHIADLLRATPGEESPSEMAERLKDGIGKLDSALATLLRGEAQRSADLLRGRLIDAGGEASLVDRIVRLYELDGTIGNIMLARALGVDEVVATQAYVRLGEALRLDWARAAVGRIVPADAWERLLAAGLGRDFEQLRLDFLARIESDDPVKAVEDWLVQHRARVEQFRALVERASDTGAPSAPMLAQIAGQARLLLAR